MLHPFTICVAATTLALMVASLCSSAPVPQMDPFGDPLMSGSMGAGGYSDPLMSGSMGAGGYSDPLMGGSTGVPGAGGMGVPGAGGMGPQTTPGASTSSVSIIPTGYSSVNEINNANQQFTMQSMMAQQNTNNILNMANNQFANVNNVLAQSVRSGSGVPSQMQTGYNPSSMGMGGSYGMGSSYGMGMGMGSGMGMGMVF